MRDALKSIKRNHILLILALIFLFIFRCFYGLNNRFWDEDEKHIYLLGLELFSFRHWPHFGADVIHTATQIPGALQSLLVGGIFFVWPQPEAPFIIVNALSLFALVLFAIYLCKHFPQYRLLSILCWITSLPWVLEYSTHIYNPSYLLLPEIMFFIAFFETIPTLTRRWIRLPFAYFWMALSLGCMMQLHLSWPLLLPFVALSLWCSRRELSLRSVIYAAIGGLIPCLLLVPTLYEHGFHVVFRSNAENSQWNLEHLSYVFNNIVRVLCYASYESFIFVGESMKQREDFLLQIFLLLPMFLMLTILTGAQLLYFFYAFLKLLLQKDVRARVSFGIFVFAILTATSVFVFSTRPPVSRNLYLLLPLALWCMFVSIDFFVRSHRWGKTIFHSVVAISLCYHALVAFNRYQHFPQQSLYSNRDLVVKSLQDKTPYIFETPRYPTSSFREEAKPQDGAEI